MAPGVEISPSTKLSPSQKFVWWNSAKSSFQCRRTETPLGPARATRSTERVPRTHFRIPLRKESVKPQCLRIGAQLLLAPGVGFEPTTYTLTACHSTVELPRNISVVNFTNDFGEYIEKETS